MTRLCSNGWGRNQRRCSLWASGPKEPALVAKPEIEQSLAGHVYEHGCVADIDEDNLPKGPTEDTVRYISEERGEPGVF